MRSIADAFSVIIGLDMRKQITQIAKLENAVLLFDKLEGKKKGKKDHKKDDLYEFIPRDSWGWKD